MKWSTRKRETKRREKYRKKEEWHKWFAWFPVSEGYYRYWLEFVDRKYKPGWWDDSGNLW